MSLAGTGVIAIWQDLIPEARHDYIDWHSREHVPERLSIPGFLRARRYVAVDGGPEFFTLYETETYEAASGKDYQDRLNAPTEWTRRIMPAFRNMARAVCRTEFSENKSESAFLLTIRLDTPPDPGKFVPQLKALASVPGVNGVHLCLADDSATKVSSFEKTFRAAADLVPPCVAMVEAESREPLQRVRDLFLKSQPADCAIYRLELSRWNSRLSHVSSSKEPAWAGE